MNINFIKTTEQDSLYDNLELKSTIEILSEINQEDKTVAYIIEKTIPKIQPLVDIIYKKITQGGRLFYIGSGTSGRLGILDASECPPTFGVDKGLVIGIDHNYLDFEVHKAMIAGLCLIDNKIIT